MNLGNMSVKIGFDGANALSGIKNMVTQFGILRWSASQVVDTFADISKKTINVGSSLNTVSKSLNIAPEVLQKWQNFSKYVGVSVDTVVGKLSEYRHNLMTWMQDPKWLEKMTQFGVPITNDPSQMLVNVINRVRQLRAMGNTNAADLLVGSEGLQSLESLISRFGEFSSYKMPTLSKKEVEELARLNGEIENTFTILETGTQKLVAATAEPLTNLLKEINTFLKENPEAAGAGSIAGAIGLGAAGLWGAKAGLGWLLGGTAATGAATVGSVGVATTTAPAVATGAGAATAGAFFGTATALGAAILAGGLGYGGGYGIAALGDALFGNKDETQRKFEERLKELQEEQKRRNTPILKEKNGDTETWYYPTNEKKDDRFLLPTVPEDPNLNEISSNASSIFNNVTNNINAVITTGADGTDVANAINQLSLQTAGDIMGSYGVR